MEFPVAIITETGGLTVLYGAASFSYGDSDSLVTHPADVWSAWSAQDWAVFCPNWRLLPVRDIPPAHVAGKRVVRRPEADWLVDADAVTATYEQVDLSAEELSAQITAARDAKVTAIQAERDRRLRAGALHQGKRFAMDGDSRTDQGGMATTAALVQLGALPWPESYAQGWISLDNTRLPLPTPQDGIALAATVAVTYSALIQHARDLKDAALAGDPASVNHTAGWP